MNVRPIKAGIIQRLEIESIYLQYNLPGFIRHGWAGFLEALEINNADVEVTSSDSELESNPNPNPQKFTFPPLIPELLKLEHINFIAHSPTGNTTIKDFNFTLLPDRPGILRIQEIEILDGHVWENVSAATTFRNRVLALTDLKPDPKISLRQLSLDASQINKNELGLSLNGTILDAKVVLTAKLTDLNKNNHLNFNFECSGLSLNAAREYLPSLPPLSGNLAQVKLLFEGDVEKLPTWSLNLMATLDTVMLNKQTLGSITASASIVKNGFRFSITDQFDKTNRADLQFDGTLPQNFTDLSGLLATGRFTLNATDLIPLTSLLPTPMSGDLLANADIHIAKGHVTLDAHTNSASLVNNAVDLSNARVAVHLEKDLFTKEPLESFKTLKTHIQLDTDSLRFEDYTADSLTIRLGSNETKVELENFSLKKSKNTVAAQAHYTLPPGGKPWLTQPLSVDFSVDAPDLHAFVTGDETVLQGSLTTSGHITAQDGIYDGKCQIAGRDIIANGLPINNIAGQIDISKSAATITAFDLVFDDKNRVHATGEMQLAAPFEYKGLVDVKVPDLSILRSLKGVHKDFQSIAGSLLISWQGYGEVSKRQHFGDGSIHLKNGQFGTQKNLVADATANYSPQYISIPDLRISADEARSASLALFWQNNRLQVGGLEVRQRNLVLLKGSIDLPFNLLTAQNVEQLIPNDQPLSIKLDTKSINLATLFPPQGEKKIPVTGILNINIDAQGTLHALQANAAIHLEKAHFTSARDIAPADISINAQLREKQLELTGSLRQELIRPLQFSGRIPLDPEALLKTGVMDPNTPIDLRINMPESSLAFLSGLLPSIRQSRGSGALNILLGGTLNQPSFTGSITGNLTTLRFKDPSRPPIDNFRLNIIFTKDRLTLERCEGGIAGGTFGASGSISFPTLNNPIFNLRVRSKDALAVQDDNITMRVSSDLRITGPLNAGSVSGNIWLTRSRFFRNIDILPIGLPGRPAPQPLPAPTVIGFPTPPFRDWKLDVRIRTEDPFLIQGNLANGNLVMDLRVVGTGIRPWMDG
ncbi:MAG: translocation/assembly module TamB domain-containing protein, partial [Chthoniobacterales bacterium]